MERHPIRPTMSSCFVGLPGLTTYAGVTLAVAFTFADVYKAVPQCAVNLFVFFFLFTHALPTHDTYVMRNT
jgi:hypothetical protein